MTDKELFAAVRALPRMTISKAGGEYRVAPHTTAIRAAWPHWDMKHCTAKAQAMAYYTDDRTDALGTAKTMSDQTATLFGA